MLESKPKAWISWSTGKDSAWALHVTRQRGEVEIVALLSTMNAKFARVAMHGVREELLDAQAEAVGLPVVKIPLPWPCPNEAYEQAMAQAMTRAREEGIRSIVFGDLFLEDVRKYREQKLAPTGLQPLFPLWGLNTTGFAREMVSKGLRAILTCIDPSKLPEHFAGRTYDDRLLEELPQGVDPCGENGEFHTFAFQGPMFSKGIPVKKGEVVGRNNFIFADVLLADHLIQHAGAAKF